MQNRSNASMLLVMALFGCAVAMLGQEGVRGSQETPKHLPNSPRKQSTLLTALSEVRPRFTTIRELASNPQRFDNQLVQFRAWPIVGWEGDDYLLEQRYRPGMLKPGVPALWFFVSEAHLREGFDPIRSMEESGAYFRGYFHYLPDSKSNGMFNPGPLQFELIEARKIR